MHFYEIKNDLAMSILARTPDGCTWSRDCPSSGSMSVVPNPSPKACAFYREMYCTYEPYRSSFLRGEGPDCDCGEHTLSKAQIKKLKLPKAQIQNVRSFARYFSSDLFAKLFVRSFRLFQTFKTPEN